MFLDTGCQHAWSGEGTEVDKYYIQEMNCLEVVFHGRLKVKEFVGY